jgi:hypothetical protein
MHHRSVGFVPPTRLLASLPATLALVLVGATGAAGQSPDRAIVADFATGGPPPGVLYGETYGASTMLDSFQDLDDCGQATEANMQPWAIAVHDGFLYMGDMAGNRIRVVKL